MTMPKSPVERFALTVTRGIGSPASIIIHTLIFAGCFGSAILGYVEWPTMLLVLTTIVSLEAIYLSIFIQMTINYTTEDIAEVAEDIEEIQEDIEEVQEDVDEIQEDIEEVQENVDELQEDVEEMSEDVEEMTEDEKEDEARKSDQKQTLSMIQTDLKKLMDDIAELQRRNNK